MIMSYDRDGIGISGYMMVHDRHMSLYDEYSVLILVMVTDVPGIRTLILVSGTCLHLQVALESNA